jgi:multidrug efflux pump
VLGVPMQTIDNALYDAFGQRQISTIFTELNQYRVVLEVAPEFRTSTALMEQLAVASNGAGALTGTKPPASARSPRRTRRPPPASAQNTGITVGAGNIIPLSALAEGSQQRAAGGQPPAAAAGGDGLVQRGAGLFAVEAVRAIQEAKDSLDMPPTCMPSSSARPPNSPAARPMWCGCCWPRWW